MRSRLQLLCWTTACFHHDNTPHLKQFSANFSAPTTTTTSMKLWIFCALLCMFHTHVLAGAAADCEKLGFPNALCSDCDTMQEYVKDEELLGDCKKCCIKDQQDNTKYSSARLEICPYKLNGLPAIQDFVDKHAAQYSNLKVVKYVGSYPKLILTDKASDKRTSVRVDNWKVSTFHEFLRERLKQPKATK